MNIFVPLLIGFLVGIGAYKINNASNDNPKVKRIMLIIGLVIAIVIAVTILFFLINAFLHK